MIGGTRELLRLSLGRLPSPQRLAAVRRRRVRELIRHVYTRVPFYRALMDAEGVTPADIRGPEDLRRIPVSGRDQLRAAGHDIFAGGVPPRAGITVWTSGSSGRPWAIVRGPGDELRRRALELRSMRAAGVRPGDRVATLGPGYEPRHRVLSRLGLFRLRHVPTSLPVSEQVARLATFRPTVLWVYPSSLRALLEHTGSLARIARPRMLITSAEALDDELRDRVRAEYGVEVRNFYGAIETGRIAFECAAGAGLHVNADCLILELEEEEAPGTGQRVVVTNLLSRAMPIVRYRLGDRCAPSAAPCPCGAALPLMRRPLGREWDLIVLPSGRIAPPWPVSQSVYQVPGVHRFRVIQRQLDRLLVQLDCPSPPPPAALEELRARLREYLAEPVVIEIELVDRIEPVAGKERVFVSQLPGVHRSGG